MSKFLFRLSFCDQLPYSQSLTGEIKSALALVVVLARQATQAGGPVRKAYDRVNYILQSGTKNLDSVRGGEREERGRERVYMDFCSVKIYSIAVLAAIHVITMCKGLLAVIVGSTP